MTAQVQSLPIDQTDNKHSNEELAYLSADYFHIEQNRLQTFDQWPVTFIRKEELARYGFYYTGTDDTVKCHFCRVEIGMWEEHDNVIEEHLRWSPYCPLLRKRPTNNVALDRNFLANVPEPSYDVCGINVRTHSYAENASDRMSGDSWSGASDISSGSNSINGNSIVGEASTSTISTDRSGLQLQMRHGGDMEAPLAGGAAASAFCSHVTSMVQTCRPEYPMYAIEADRLKSFEDWPTSMSQKPQQLSDAGFFYTGKSDRVKCFSCGGGLKDWEQGDDPWEQHGIWYSNCHYLKLIKGREFIDRCLAMKADEEAASSQPSTSGVSSNASSLMSTSPTTSSGISSPAPGDDARTSSSNSNSTETTTTTTTVTPKAASSTIGSAVEGDDDAASRGISDGKICKICYVNEYNIAFLPCGHVVACAKCASSVTKCPMCQQPFYNVLKLYLS
ncbi:death-associated inhibitor of apoptosis 1-like [Anopheles darlingi]|uniref:death-associated inhibitor of apoptosis 1-like n=1 Tax=Anopheles darlingi TaxID=43151 RepID=UPI0021002C73|nr:death-associated inhibitor of apoptosis 1-like [Anopheles darlingi]XP_049539577.1 death-associated inhibitor of apoptosis 1-like [Anopheles darlingi]